MPEEKEHDDRDTLLNIAKKMSVPKPIRDAVKDEVEKNEILRICEEVKAIPPRAGWKKNAGHYNEILMGRGFFISYQGNELIRRMDERSGFPPSNTDSANPETALCLPPPFKWMCRLHHKASHLSMKMLMKKDSTGFRRKTPWYYHIVKLVYRITRTQYLILRGDHREAYEKIAPKGKKACIAYWSEHSGEHHFFTDVIKK